MSLYIRGMEMPKNKPLIIKINPDGTVNSTVGNGYQKYEAIELPEHGRLIDADANIATMEKCAKALDHCTEQLCYNFASSIMKDAPTIIPASGGET